MGFFFHIVPFHPSVRTYWAPNSCSHFDPLLGHKDAVFRCHTTRIMPCGRAKSDRFASVRFSTLDALRSSSLCAVSPLPGCLPFLTGMAYHIETETFRTFCRRPRNRPSLHPRLIGIRRFQSKLYNQREQGRDAHRLPWSACFYAVSFLLVTFLGSILSRSGYTPYSSSGSQAYPNKPIRVEGPYVSNCNQTTYHC